MKRLAARGVMLAGLWLGAWAVVSAGDDVESIDYATHIAPLLAAHCSECHGADVQESGLRLDTGPALLRGGNRGPALVAGQPEQSLLYQVLIGHGETSPMPFEKPRLDAQSIDLVKRWIDSGALIPTTEPREPETVQSDHWAFQPIDRPALPAITNSGWVRTPIDVFVLAQLERQQISPSPEADRITLLRRLSLDLLGLPPSVAEIETFLGDTQPGAYERLVERLLASPHFGERWGRHWLDVARYADSNGFTIDGPRSIWNYRDWVIDAFNRDLPFDQFTIEQLAGDLLTEATSDQLIATGFHRNTLVNEEGGTDDEQFRVDAVADRVDTTATVFLGLTVACARCHQHKYDPISQREYYDLFAIFNNCDEPALPLPSAAQSSELEGLKAQIAELEGELGTLAAADEPRKTCEARIAELKKRQEAVTQSITTTMILRERKETRESFIHVRGDFLRHGARVTGGVPAVLPRLHSTEGVPIRLDFARWLVAPENPLTARVTINRVWQRLFGAGLVRTENDFGLQGSPPTHPELLDWLASEFMRRDWSTKAMLRLIVTSATYRQSSDAREELLDSDPDNRLLARQSRLRLEAETIRDVCLAAGGLLTSKIGGPGVYPPQPEGIYVLTQNQKDWKASTGPDRFRRGMYTFFWRSSPYPLMPTFDAPDANTTCTRRVRSNTPLQALMLANDRAFFEIAQGLALRVLGEGPPDDEGRLSFAFRLCLSREPDENEAGRLLAFCENQASAFAADEALARAAAPAGLPEGVTLAQGAAWTALARVLLNLDETITRE